MATVTLGTADADRIEPVTRQVQVIFDRLEQELSTYRSDSTISLLANKAGVTPIAVSEDTLQVLSVARHFGELSEGAFDVTVAPLVNLYGFGKSPTPAAFPSEAVIREQLTLVDYRKLLLKDRTAFLPLKGMAVDLGGIAKGYAVDRAFDSCRSARVEDFLIDLSGNIRVYGRPQWGEDWQIGVRDPFDRSRIIGKVTLRSGMALATSGSYERFVEMGGQRYSHIINPKTGYPISGTAGVTILAEDATTADGWSTAFFIAGLKGTDKFRQKTPSVDVLIVPDKYPTEIWVTPGLAKVFVPLPEFSEAMRLLHP
ncbi:MAG: FAD:protein FMN transferase [Acidobacteria bacterium]|nr:FAD:protein FMN transferase [Acidobacteriota bacterium]